MVSSHSRAGARTPVAIAYRIFPVLLLTLLMSCTVDLGSDGGGGDRLSISLDRNSLTWSQYPGDSPAQQTITATTRGTFDGTLHAAVVIENNGAVNAIEDAVELEISGTQAVATVTPVANLAAGTYSGRLLFLACSDPACNNRIGGTPLPVSFTVNVLTPVRAAPEALTRTVTSGSSVTEDFVVTPGQNETGFGIGTTSPFVQITNASAGGFRLKLQSLPAGTYTASVPLTGNKGSRASIPVTYVVVPPEAGQQPLTVSPTGLTFATTEGAVSAVRRVQVSEASWRPGLQAPTIQYLSGENWLRVTGSAGGYELVADAKSLRRGTYNALLVVRNSPLPAGIPEPFSQTHAEVPVSLTVDPGLIKPADVLQEINSTSTVTALSGTVPIDVFGGPAVTWNAVSDVEWLAVSPSGTTGSELSYSIDPAWLASAPGFVEQAATVTVSAPDTVLTPVTFSIRVTPRLAEITGVGARVQLAGQATTLVVSGRGFGALADPAARVAVTGVTPSSVQRVSDSKLLVSLDSLDPGTYEIAIRNALDIDTLSRSIVAVSPTTHQYATAPTGEKMDMLIVDHERDTLYGVARTAGKLFRFRFAGSSGWTVDSPDVAAVDNVGLLPDGDVIVMSLPGTLAILDRDTLTEKFSKDLGCAAEHGITDAGIPVSLDGRVWVAMSDAPGCTRFRAGKLGIFDPATRQLSLLPVPSHELLSDRFESGPDMLMSRNGERLVIHQDNGPTFAPLVYLDASEPMLTPTSTEAPHWYITAALSDDGNRLLLDMDRLLDAQFEVVGRAIIPAYSDDPVDASEKGTAALSPDGTRAYVLTYRSADLDQPSTPFLPRVYVLDTSGNVLDNPLPLLGYFELPDYPSCISDTRACEVHPPVAISLDGRTLFFAGSDKFVVVPIPETLIPISAESSRRAPAPVRTRVWRLPGLSR